MLEAQNKNSKSLTHVNERCDFLEGSGWLPVDVQQLPRRV